MQKTRDTVVGVVEFPEEWDDARIDAKVAEINAGPAGRGPATDPRIDAVLASMPDRQGDRVQRMAGDVLRVTDTPLDPRFGDRSTLAGIAQDVTTGGAAANPYLLQKLQENADWLAPLLGGVAGTMTGGPGPGTLGGAAIGAALAGAGTYASDQALNRPANPDRYVRNMALAGLTGGAGAAVKTVLPIAGGVSQAAPYVLSSGVKVTPKAVATPATNLAVRLRPEILEGWRRGAGAVGNAAVHTLKSPGFQQGLGIGGGGSLVAYLLSQMLGGNGGAPSAPGGGTP